MHILLYEQATCEKGTKMEKCLLGIYSKIFIAILALLFNDETSNDESTVQRTVKGK